MSDITKKEILSIYEELKGLLETIKDETSWFDDKGFTEHANRIIERVRLVCPEITDIDSYKIIAEYSSGRHCNTVNVLPTKAKINSLIGRIKGLNNFDINSNSNNGNTFIQTQSQSQSLSVILELQEKIITEIPKYNEGTKERSFLEKLKSKLSEVKNITDILSIALKIGSEFGLDPSTIHRLLGL
jgi:hypothetical protein